MKDKIYITYRDINGKRDTVEFDSHYAVLNWIEAGEISEDDEILVVAKGSLCLFSALSSTFSLSIDNLSGFFA